ncbi:MAG: N-formylglutamate amidohydrolase [Hyphomonadaceae bacterium]|nr:N-formylglutamate amidohydrolase [Hyphomonadaceae bacterium]
MTEYRPDHGSTSDLLSGAHDPSPVQVWNQGGTSPFLIVGDHAGRAIPLKLDGLGLDPASLDLHIAWDIGVAGLGEILAEKLDACFISQTYSRLVIDCNRSLADASSIAASSDGIDIPGNANIGAADRLERQCAIHRPYHDAISAELARRAARSQPTLLVALHSFTPVMQQFQRPWQFGILHRDDSRLSSSVLDLLRAELGDAVGDNQPYRLDEKDFTVPTHADPRGLDYLELEVRQDLIGDRPGQEAVASLIAPLLLRVGSEMSAHKGHDDS